MSFGELMREVGSEHVFGALPESRVTLAEALAGQGYGSAAFVGAASIGFSQGFDVYRQNMEKVSRPALDEMLSWVDANSGGPFLLFWHSFEVHAPYLETRFLSEVLPEERASTLEEAIATLSSRPKRPVRPDANCSRLTGLWSPPSARLSI